MLCQRLTSRWFRLATAKRRCSRHSGGVRRPNEYASTGSSSSSTAACDSGNRAAWRRALLGAYTLHFQNQLGEPAPGICACIGPGWNSGAMALWASSPQAMAVVVHGSCSAFRGDWHSMGCRETGLGFPAISLLCAMRGIDPGSVAALLADSEEMVSCVGRLTKSLERTREG